MRGYALAERELCSFDRRCRARVQWQRPDRYRLLTALPTDAPRIARGGGVSYVGASFGDGAISQDMGAFDRLLAFDRDNGLLSVEAGARIADVVRFTLARGWYLPVVPGHPGASVGGCIAADVHGKNPARDGTFSRHVAGLELLAADGQLHHLDAHENADAFAATCAGFGLTGTIVAATLRLAPAPVAFGVRRLPVRDLAEAAEVMRAHASAPLLYGWHDGRPGRLGRGVIRFGLEAHETPPRARLRPDLPASIAPTRIVRWNRLGIAAADTWLGLRWCRPGHELLAVEQALFPLNAARGYFAGFGRPGLIEAQWLVPHAAFDAFAEALTGVVARLRPRISLISSKLFAGVADGLRFDGDGIALAIHVPEPDQPAQRAFLEALAETAIAHGGRPNLIKDSSLDAATVRRAIPDFDAAAHALRAFAPEGLYRSELTRRIEL